MSNNVNQLTSIVVLITMPRNISDEEVISTARSCANETEWSKKFHRHWKTAYDYNLLDKVREFLPRGIGVRQSEYSDDYLINFAKMFSNQQEWIKASHALRDTEGKPSPHGVAYHRGRDFVKKCTSHMVRSPKHQPNKYSNELLLADALKYDQRNKWKRASPRLYSTARNRGDEFYDKCIAHMVPPINPWGGSYIIYVYEFSDGHAYVGLTCNPESRHKSHQRRGRVHEHREICPSVVYRVLQDQIMSPKDAIDAECSWIEKYKLTHTLLNKAPGGSTGSMDRKWDSDSLLLDALKYKTRRAWLWGNQSAYKAAKKYGCFDECVSHMPRRTNEDLLCRSVSKESREKMSLAKKGCTLTDEHKAKISAGVRSVFPEIMRRQAEGIASCIAAGEPYGRPRKVIQLQEAGSDQG